MPIYTYPIKYQWLKQLKVMLDKLVIRTLKKPLGRLRFSTWWCSVHPREHNPHRSFMLLRKRVSMALLLRPCKLATGRDTEAKTILLEALVSHLCR